MTLKQVAIVGMIISIAWLQYCLHLREDDGYRQIASLEQKILQMSQEKEKYTNKNKILQTQLTEIRHNPKYLQTLAREILFMIDEGEIYVSTD